MTESPLGTPVVNDISSGPNPLAALALGWLIPGAGHVYAGQWRKGVFFFVMVMALLAIGTYLGSGTVFQPSPWFFPQFFAGGPMLALVPVSIHLAHAPGGIDWADRLHETGILYTAVAGFMNALIMMDVFLRLTLPTHPAKTTEERAA
jgi:hypothetical protein